MPTNPDRRAFLAAATAVAFGPTDLGAKDPPKQPTGDDLKVLPADEVPAIPAGARRLGSRSMRVTNYINRIKFTPTGTKLVAAEGDEIRGWDARTGKVLFRFKYPEGFTVSAGRPTTGDTFALLVHPSNGGNYQFRHYAFGSGKLITKTDALDFVNSANDCFSPDGARAALILNNTLVVLDALKGKELWREDLPAQSIGGLVFAPDGKQLILGSLREVRVFDVATKKVVREHRAELPKKEDGGDNARVAEPIVSPDGVWIAAQAGTDEDAIAIWHAADAKPKFVVKSAKPLAFTTDALMTFHEGRITFWDLKSGKELRHLVVGAHEFEVSADGSILAVSIDDAVLLLDAKTGQPLPHSADPPGLPTKLQFLGDRIRGEVRGPKWFEWTERSRASQALTIPNLGDMTLVALSNDAKVSLVHKADKYEVRDAAGKTLREIPADYLGSELFSNTLSPDGRKVIRAVKSSLRIFDVVGGKPRDVRGSGAEVRVDQAIRLSGDGRIAGVALLGHGSEESQAIDLFDLPTESFVRRLGLKQPVLNFKLSPDGRLVAVVHEQQNGRFNEKQMMRVYDATSGRMLLEFTAEGGADAAIAISPDSRLFARMETNARSESKIAIWEIFAAQPRMRLSAPGSVSAMAFSPDGRSLATSGAGGPILIWDLFHGRKEADPPTPVELDRAWDTLSGNGEEAFAAIARLAQFPDRALPFLRTKLKPIQPPNVADVTKWIEALDHRDYRKREAGSKSLNELGERGRDPLQKALANNPTPETRERIEKLLSIAEKLTAEHLRMLRAVEAVELSNTSAGRDLLANWATGAPGAVLTREASAARERMPR